MQPHAENKALTEAWLYAMQYRRGRADSTIRVYRHVIGEWVRHLGAIPITEVEVSDMDEFVARPRTKTPVEGGSAATRRKEASVLRSFYKWVYSQHLTEVDLALGLHTPTVHNVQPKSLTDEHWLSMWNSLYVRTNMKAVVVLGLGFFCGLRRSEMTQLHGSQIQGGQIQHFTRKGGGEDVIHWASMFEVYRTRLPHLVGDIPEQFPSVLEWMASKAGDELLLGWSAGGNMNDALDRWARLADTPRLTPHQLRHSCATNLLRAGVPLHIVSSLLNHRSINTTMRYVRAGHDALAEWMERGGPPVSVPSLHLQDSAPPPSVTDVDIGGLWREGDAQAEGPQDGGTLGGHVDAQTRDRGTDR